MTTAHDTAATLEAAIDAHGANASGARAALHRAITAHVEAEVARRLEAAPGVEAAIDNLRRVDRQSYASGGVESVWPARKALLAAIAADRARAVAEAVDLDAIALAADLIGRHLAPTSDVARGAVARLEAMLAGKPARPTPDEARSIGRVAEHLRGLAAEVEPSRMADGFEADRMRTLAHRLRQVAALMPDADEARRLAEALETACDMWQYRDAEARAAARTALLRALGVEA